MNRATKIEFLRRKVELIAENSCSEVHEANIRRMFPGIVDHLARFPSAPMAELNGLDRELETFLKLVVLPPDHGDVRSALIREFGVSRLNASTKTVVSRVLKRGSIVSEDEYYQVQDVLASVDNIEKLGEEKYQKLDQLAHEFQPPDGSEEPAPARKSSTPSVEMEPEPRTPRWPMVPPEGDERICPPNTALEVMEAFLRKKLARVLRHTGDPDAVAWQERTLDESIRRVHGPTTAMEHKNDAMRYLDHEVDARSGLSVTMEQLRTIEEDLDAEFGFRRLLPSPRQMGLNAIASGNRNDWRGRLIIERALADYTAPPIFTRDEARRLKALFNFSGR